MHLHCRMSLGKVLFVILCGMLAYIIFHRSDCMVRILRMEWEYSNPVIAFFQQLACKKENKTIAGWAIPELGFCEIQNDWVWDKQDPSYIAPMDFIEELQMFEECTKEELKEKESEEEVQEVAGTNVVAFERPNLLDFSNLLEKYYTVTSITQLKPELFHVEEALDMDMTMKTDNTNPQILIFHTHSQEGFADSLEGDASTTIVGVGEYLADILRNQYGYNVLHDTSVYDLVDGKLDRSAAYTYAEKGLEEILKENPSIEVIIDLHRDGVDENNHLITQIDGKTTAKIMFFNGISYTKVNGNLSYLPNPYVEENLAMSLQLKLLGELYYPGFLRKNYINGYRYCLHYRGKSMLIEAGAQNNTLEEEKNAMEILAKLLHKLFTGERAYK